MWLLTNLLESANKKTTDAFEKIKSSSELYDFYRNFVTLKFNNDVFPDVKIDQQNKELKSFEKDKNVDFRLIREILVFTCMVEESL